jgi:signal transduction histidine kinase
VELQDAWLIAVAAAFLAMVAVVWAVVLAGRALRSRGVLTDAVAALGRGELGRRLDEKDVGRGAADTFNQAARDLEDHLERARGAEAAVRSLAAGLPDRVILELNRAGEVREICGDLEALLGHRHEAVMERHASFFFPAEEDWAKLERQVIAPASVGRTLARSIALRRGDGELIRGEIRLKARPEGGYWLALQEPAPGLEAEGRARLLEGRLNALTDGLPDGVLILVEGRIASINRNFADLLGSRPDDLVGTSFLSLVVPADVVRATAIVADGEGALDPVVLLRLRAPGGEPVQLSVSVGRAVLEEKKAQILLARDATFQQRSERRLALSGAWLGAALEAGRDGQAVFAGEEDGGAWSPVLMNSAFARLLGLPSGQLPDRDGLDQALRQRLQDPGLFNALLAGLEAEPASSAEAVFETSHEPARALEILARPIELGPGKYAGCLLSVRDVTESRRREEDLRQRTHEQDEALSDAEAVRRDLEAACDERAGKTEELEKLCDELKNRDEMKTNLLANFSHELQTPLVSVRGYTEMILREDLGPITADQRQGLEVSLRNVQRLVGLIEQLMTFARTEEALTELTLESFPVWPLLEENISLLGDRVKEKELRVTTRYLTEHLAVLADRGLIGQVFSNVLGNAVKYSGQGGEVAVTISEGAADDELQVEVRDAGVGIPPEEQERVFERGYRASTAGGTRGSGIGLSLVREILKRHGCRIRVDSLPGEGATFSFTLPRAPHENETGVGTAG